MPCCFPSVKVIGIATIRSVRFAFLLLQWLCFSLRNPPVLQLHLCPWLSKNSRHSLPFWLSHRAFSLCQDVPINKYARPAPTSAEGK